MAQEILNSRERVSSLADGELGDAAFAGTVELLTDNADARASWHAYHLVGDVLRSPELAATSAGDAAFVARWRQRLADEALAPRSALGIDLGADGAAAVRTSDLRRAGNASANAARWKLVAGFASLAAVAVLGWQFVLGLDAAGSAAQLAQHAAPVAPVTLLAGTDAPQPVMIRDPRLDQLLAAHQQFGGTSALQMPAGFLRNATFERSAR